MNFLKTKNVNIRFLSAITILCCALMMMLVVACAEDEEEEITNPQLTITSFDPTSGTVGDTVTIAGTAFSSTAASNVVAFNGTEATVISATATSIMAIVPENATTGIISVTVDGETVSSDSDFTVTTDDTADTEDDKDDGDTDGTVDCSDATTPTELVVCAANAFMETLTDDQLSTLIVDYAVENATAWSNLPCGSNCRVGLQLSDLTDTQKAAALAVVKAATGSSENEGYAEINQIRAADDVLSSAGGMGGGGGPGGMGGYGGDIYLIAFLGTPSTTETWQFQFGGHHLAYNITYKAGAVAGATPLFEGVEPTSWTADDGTEYAPLVQEHDGMAAMLASLTDSELTSAKLSTSFSDVVIGPGEDGEFPATKSGLACSALTADQKALVIEAMKPWVMDADDQTAAELLATYESELDQTYIAYSGNATLENHQDYVRIDGPSVWIEFVCQNGVVYQNQIHYHTVWRDHLRDYGANFSF